MDNENLNSPSNGWIRRAFHSAELKLYISFFLSSWGDRMWAFALSIALGSIGHQNMQLTAVSGFVNSIVVLFLGATVGRWIDKTARLKAATTILTINNVSVFLSAALLFSILYKPDSIIPIWNGGLQTLLISLSIALCAVSVLASMGTKICMTKDWIVVVAANDRDKLTSINAWMLRLDLTSLVLSPLVAGQIMTSLHPAAGCFFLACWNLVSFGIEYTFLRLVYNSYPALAVKPVAPHAAENQPVGETCDQTTQDLSGAHIEDPSHCVESTETDNLSHNPPGTASRNTGCCSTMKNHVVSAVNGWKTYFRQSVCPASVALALLYLTVLGFDGITIVYVYSQGIQENIVALCQGIGAIFGIMGSFVYPYLRKRIGLERAGLYALASQILCNTFALASIWLPGSPFDPMQYFDPSNVNNNANDNLFVNESTLYFTNVTSSTPVQHGSKCSISAFLVGIVLARFGLWIADLSISQIMQEKIAEHERGVVNGVQNALNMTLNMVKDVLVIFLPNPNTFGILIIISYCSVSSGFVSFSFYSHKIRGHVLPFHNQLKSLCVQKFADENEQQQIPADDPDDDPTSPNVTKF